MTVLGFLLGNFGGRIMCSRGIFSYPLSSLVSVLFLLSFAACSSSGVGGASDMLNPFAEAAPSDDIAGQSNPSALMGGVGQSAKKARHALEVMGSYRRAQHPQPTYPVRQPEEVRLMWIPDHLNKVGDLVTAHYYYLLVLPSRWAVQDAFEVDKQLSGGNQAAGGAVPWVYKEVK